MHRITQPDIRPVAKGVYRLHQEYSYTTVLDKSVAVTIVVKAGFECDGASVPRWLWSLSGITPNGLIIAAALIHDAIYSVKGKLNKFNRWIEHHVLDEDGVYHREPLEINREQADKIFLEIMEWSDIGKTDRLRAYWAVRLFGWYAWRKKG